MPGNPGVVLSPLTQGDAMRRTLIALAAGAAMLSFVPTTQANASHSCAQGFEIICFIGCPSPPKICPWP